MQAESFDLPEEALEEALMHEPSLLSQQTMDSNKMTRMVLDISSLPKFGPGDF